MDRRHEGGGVAQSEGRHGNTRTWDGDALHGTAARPCDLLAAGATHNVRAMEDPWILDPHQAQHSDAWQLAG
jgi:hypothetical protein